MADAHKSSFMSQLITMGTGQSEEARQAALEKEVKTRAEQNQMIRQMVSMYGATESAAQKQSVAETQATHADQSRKYDARAEDQELEAQKARMEIDRLSMEEQRISRQKSSLREYVEDLDARASENRAKASKPYNPADYGL